MGRVRVLHLVTRDQRRGAEVDAVDLARLLAGAGTEGTVRALAPCPAGRRPLGVPALGPSPLHPVTLQALRYEATRHDVVVAHGSSTLPASRLALLGTPIPFVYRTIGCPDAWARTRSRRARVRWMLAGSSRIAALCEGSRRDVLRLYRPRPERVSVVGCAHSAERYRPATAAERARAREQLGLPQDVPVVVLVAALSAEKRVPDAVEALRAVPDAVLVVVGDGPLRAELEQASRADRARVRLTGQLDDVRPALHAADVAVLTSGTEGVPGALVQAGLCGVPAVATRVGYVDEVVLDGATGRLVEVGDVPGIARAVAEALSRAPAWGPAARAHCRAAFDPVRARDRWLELLAAAA
jgi:glycosyltransferase involved in cell wall biosynthesis